MSTFDFHCHSTASDGGLSPTDLATRAAEFGVELLCLTDHDTVAGVEEAKSAGARVGLTVLAGIELSAQWMGVEIHIVGFNINHLDSALIAFIEAQKQRRINRAMKMSQRLEKCKIMDVFEDAMEIANGGTIGRAHFAQVLVSRGVVKNNNDAFKKYLGQGKPGYAKPEWPDVDEIVDIIHVAGGKAVLAHPLRYRFTNNKLRKLVEHFKSTGGDAIEVVRSGENPQQKEHLQKLALDHGLLASGGSDFHSPGAKWCELGKFADIPAQCDSLVENYK